MPDVTGEDEVRTWFQGYKYHGGFRYERIGGGDLTVVSVVDMETYIKGVIPFEMSNDWPLEALKAQAICAQELCLQQHLSEQAQRPPLRRVQFHGLPGLPGGRLQRQQLSVHRPH